MRKFLNTPVAVAAGALVLVGIGGVGSAVAVGGDNPSIPNQSIGSVDIGQDAIGSSELRPAAAKKAHIAKNSVGWHGEMNPFTKDKIKQIAHDEAVEHASEVEGAEGPQGPKGEQGEPGPAGPAGPAGEDGVSGAYTAKPAANVISVAPGKIGGTTITCTEGKVALSGGYEVEGTRPNVAVLRNQPAGSYSDGMFNGWNVQVKNNGDKVATVQTAVVCADAN